MKYVFHKKRIIIVCLTMFLSACNSEVQFEKLPEVQEVIKNEDVRVEIPTSFTDTFNTKVNGTEGKVDLVWVVDNSSSMTEEAEHVRNNLYNFLNYVKDKSDLKFKLISRLGDSFTYVKIPFPESDQFSQIDFSIGSWNSLKMVSNFIESGALDDFYREDSLKYFVFVTDDNSTEMNARNFLADINANLPSGDVTVSGFIGHGGSESPCQAATGNEYMQLESITDGYMFNICDTDWSDHFATLADHVSLSANNKFKLKNKKILEIEEVRVNGEKVSLSLVSRKNDTLTINFPVEKYTANDKLKVEIDYIALK